MAPNPAGTGHLREPWDTRLEVFDPDGPSAELIDLFHQAFAHVTITLAGAPLTA